MDLLSILIAVLVFALIAYVIHHYVPIDATVKNIGLIILFIVFVLWVVRGGKLGLV